MKQTIEEKINTVLTNGSTGSASLVELIRETEEAASVAETDHARALDIGCSDPAQAEASTRAAELRRDRLVLALPRLQDRLSAALTGERHARWLADFGRVKEKHDALAQEFADVYRR